MTILTYRQIMSVSRAANVLDLHPETVRRRAAAGKLKHIKHGTMYVFDADYIYRLSVEAERERESGPQIEEVLTQAEKPTRQNKEPRTLYPAMLTQPPFDTSKPKATPPPQPKPKTSPPVVEAAPQLVVEVSEPDEAQLEEQPAEIPFFGARFDGKVYRPVYVDGLGHITAVR